MNLGMRLWVTLLVLAVSFVFLDGKPSSLSQDDGLSLTILHVNDVHAHFEEVNVITGRCHEELARASQCYGGMARMYTYIKEVTEVEDNVLVLNAGDYYQGTIWYTEFKYEPVVRFGNMLNYTALGLGNHEFDDGLEGLDPFTEEANYDVLAANIDERQADDVPILMDTVKKSVVKIINDIKVGIIGYVTTKTPDFSHPGSTIAFTDEISSVAAEARRLKTDEGVNILIALGHAGYDIDMEMARSIPEIDVVVGGHSHTFLYTGDDLPSIETPAGPFPTYIEQPDTGKIVPVVQAYCYTKYLGHLKLTFDTDGNLLYPLEKADVVLLDSSIAKDPYIEELLETYKQNLSDYKEVVGESLVNLTKVFQGEGNLGNLLADSNVAAWAGEAQIGLMNNGGIRTNLIAGEITKEDILNVMPFNNTVDKIKIKGEDLKTVLEENVYGLCPNQSCYSASLLQLSGLRVVYDIYDNNMGKRASKLEIPCGADSWCDLDMDEIYDVALPNFLADGGVRYLGLPDYIQDRETGPPDYLVFEQYVREHSPIDIQIEGRIIINYHPGDGASPSSAFTPSIHPKLSCLLIALLYFMSS